MKKVLLGTTAIVAAGMIASSPASAAEKISAKVGGYMEQWIGYASVDQSGSARDVDGFDIKSDSEIHFTGSTTLDNGIEFGVNVQLEANSNSGDQIDESYLIVKGSFGEINLGSENSAMYKMHYAPTDYGISLNSGDQIDWAAVSGSGISTGGYFRNPYGSTYVEPGQANDSEKLTYYTPRFGGFQLGVSYSPDSNQDNNNSPDRDAANTDMVAVGANFKGDFAGASVGVSGGYGKFLSSASGSSSEPEAWNVGLTVGFGGFSVGASYADADENTNGTNGNGYNIGVAYTTGPLGISLTYFDGEREGTTTAGVTTGQAEQQTVHLSANYTLGPGVTAAATLGHANFESDDAGVSEIEATYFVTGIKLSF
jgi:predicted porin